MAQPCGPPDPCEDILKEILRLLASVQKRYWNLRNDVGGLPLTKPAVPDPRYGTRSITGERQAFNDDQQGLRKRLKDWDANNCGDPPPAAWDWATRPTPAADPKPVVAPKPVVNREMVETGAKVGATVGTGYIIYRVIRMIPSLLPPFWETIPANAAIP